MVLTLFFLIAEDRDEFISPIWGNNVLALDYAV